MKRRVLFWLVPVLCLLCCILFWMAAFTPLNGIWVYWLPRYSEKNLLGLTPNQVVERLGPPSYDPRRALFGSTRPGWTNEEQDGPLVLGYYRGWTTVSIEFKNERVVAVWKSEK
jgi:hypothetical protein